VRPVAEQLDHIMRGVDAVVPAADLAERLEEGRPLRVKLGVDPTAPDVHLGWAVVLDLWRRFQDMGHTAVRIIGDFTAQVGDPSGKSETRRRLSGEEVAGYAASCLEMLQPMLLSERLEVRYNSEWLAPMDMRDVLTLASQVTVSRILERDDFAKRLEAGQPVSLIEVLYPLLQGMDSVAVSSDIEIGGSDQLWNLLVGRDLQTRHDQQAQIAMTVPLLVGLDGKRKMSQSYGNYVSVKDAADTMFGKIMSLPDDVMGQYLLLATEIPEPEVADIVDGLADGSLHPGEVKRRLSREVVARYWGEDAAVGAEAGFDRVFREKQAPEEVAEFPLPADDPVWLPALPKAAGVVPSTSEARRLVAQGAVRIEGEPVTGEEVARAGLENRIVKVGKRRFVRFVTR